MEAAVRIAIVGCGEVGTTYLRALAEHGEHDVVVVDPAPRDPLREIVAAGGPTLLAEPGEALTGADVVWLCVAGDIAHEVIAGLRPWLRPGARVLDLTTASPDDKHRSAALLADHATYVDVVIMGAIAMGGVATPLLAAGPEASAATTELAAIGAPVRVLPGAGPGDAAALKLLRSILTKGIEALGVECLAAAEALGVREELPVVLADIDAGGLTPFVEAVVRTHPQHAERRRHEVHRAGRQLADLGRPSALVDAVEARFAATVDAT
ncbi:NAD(P)-binding domain-containing protein [Janibacter sp. G368]|uniref:NAD(P)-binding domain-containing protein n=1 Tax=Janibacter sp. G368 TaxID=3420441 RepID=UPI003D03011C